MRDVLDRLEILAAWLKPGGQTPDEPIPDKYSTLVEAISEIKRARGVAQAPTKPDQWDLAQFMCSELALEDWDELSRTKYLGDAGAILKFLSNTSAQAAPS